MFGLRSTTLLVLLAVAPSVTVAQSGLSGYILTLPVYQRYADDQLIFPGIPRSQFSELTRLRLRVPVPLTPTAYLQVEAEGALEYASQRQHGLSSSTSSGRQLVDLTAVSGEQELFKTIALVDRFFVRFEVEGVDIIAGRQRISWGVGRVWSPTDLFNPINPAILGKVEKDGADAILGKVTFGNFSDLSIVVNGARDPGQLNTGFRLRTLIKEVAVSVMGGVFDERIVAGGDVTLDVWDAGVRAEALVGAKRTAQGIFRIGSTSVQPSDGFVSLVVGVDNQFTSRFYGMAEYFYNGRGETDRFRYDPLQLASSGVTNLGRDILAVQGSYLVHPLATVSLTLIRNLNDESMLISPQILVLATDEISFSMGGQYFTGGMFSEYWYYPSTIYGRADLYF